MSKDSDQTETAPRKFKLGPLGNLNQVTKGLAKTIRAMAAGTLDSQIGASQPNKHKLKFISSINKPFEPPNIGPRGERGLECECATLLSQAFQPLQHHAPCLDGNASRVKRR